jgi:hypothetical protein
MAELVDALVSGTSDESRGGSSPLLGTKPHPILIHSGLKTMIASFAGFFVAISSGSQKNRIAFLITSLLCPQVFLQFFAHSWRASKRMG